MTKLHVVRDALTARQLRHMAAFRTLGRPDPAVMANAARIPRTSVIDQLRPTDHDVSIIHNFNGVSNTTVPRFFGPDSPITRPSAAFTILGSSAITIAVAGNGPHQSFTDAPPFNEPRWGDYSWAVVDPDNGGVWLGRRLARHRVHPVPAFQAEVNNWGTDVFEVARN